MIFFFALFLNDFIFSLSPCLDSSKKNSYLQTFTSFSSEDISSILNSKDLTFEKLNSLVTTLCSSSSSYDKFQFIQSVFEFSSPFSFKIPPNYIEDAVFRILESWDPKDPQRVQVFKDFFDFILSLADPLTALKNDSTLNFLRKISGLITDQEYSLVEEQLIQIQSLLGESFMSQVFLYTSHSSQTSPVSYALFKKCIASSTRDSFHLSREIQCLFNSSLSDSWIDRIFLEEDIDPLQLETLIDILVSLGQDSVFKKIIQTQNPRFSDALWVSVLLRRKEKWFFRCLSRYRHENKNHLIKRMFKKIGHTKSSLFDAMCHYILHEQTPPNELLHFLKFIIAEKDYHLSPNPLLINTFYYYDDIFFKIISILKDQDNSSFKEALNLYWNHFLSSVLFSYFFDPTEKLTLFEPALQWTDDSFIKEREDLFSPIKEHLLFPHNKLYLLDKKDSSHDLDLQWGIKQSQLSYFSEIDEDFMLQQAIQLSLQSFSIDNTLSLDDSVLTTSSFPPPIPQPFSELSSHSDSFA